ncbi:MAG: hypothetical protein R2799_13375 [Crocinitomicaceae bacterium]
MKENKLIASVVLFKELLDKEKDIYDIIAEFIKSAVIDKQKWTFNSTEIKDLLEDVFDFKLPEAVIRTTIKNRLVKSDFVSHNNGEYSVTNIQERINPEFEQNFNFNRTEYGKTEKEIISYIETKRGRNLTASEQNQIRENLSHYLLDNNISGDYIKDISEFIVTKSQDLEFTKRLNVVKQGIVLYSGVRFTADLNELGKWSKPLTIFLDTEILFHFAGYNGSVYQQIFNDFLKLVREINQANKDKIIQLKYFSETEKEIHDFFHVATLIIENKKSLDPSKTAMKEITNGCKSKSDIIIKKTYFFNNLKTSGIHLEEEKNYYENHEYNIEGSEIVEELSKLSKENHREFNEEYCKNNLKLFTKINTLRKGKNDLGFENCKFILLTGNRYIHYLAHNPKIKNNEKDIPFASDIDFVTDKFWFKLKKGFGNSEDIPKSFDIISKAQMVLAAHVSDNIHEKYNELNEKYTKGEITKEDAISIVYELRENSLKPEDFTDVTIQDKLSFIDNFSIADHLREKEILSKQAKEGIKAKEELKRRDRLDRNQKFKTAKIIVRISSFVGKALFFILSVLIYYIGYIVIKSIITENDTLFSIVCSVVGLILIFPVWKYYRPYMDFLKKILVNSYKRKINNA